MTTTSSPVEPTGYKRGTELSDSALTYSAADKSAGLSAGVAGLGGADQITLDASGTYLGGPGSDTFNLGPSLAGLYTVVGWDQTKQQPYQHVPLVDDADTINVGSASITSIDLTAGRISGTNATTGTPFTVDFSGVERITGASSPAGHVVSGRVPIFGFSYSPSGSDQISVPLGLDQPNPGFLVTYGRGSFWSAGISVSYSEQGIGRVSSSAFPGAAGDTLERLTGVAGTGAADVFDMRNFGTNAAGTKMNIVGVSAGDVVIGNGETRLLLPGAALGASAPSAGGFLTLPDFTRRVVVDLTAGSFEAYTSSVTNSNFNAWAGAVKFSGVQGVYGSLLDETMLGDERDNFFRPQDGDDFVDGRGGLDELEYWRAAEPVTIYMAGGVVVGGPSSGVDTFRRIEMVTGTVYADRYDASGFGSARAVNEGDQGSYNAYRPAGGNDVVIGNGQTHVLYDLTLLPVEVNLAEGYAQARLEADRLITDDRSVGVHRLSGVNRVSGTVFGDVLIGDGENNVLEGRAGNDTINGGAGHDVAVFSGARSFYTIQATAADRYTVTDTRASQIQDPVNGAWSLNDGTDQLISIEMLRFADGELTLGAGLKFSAVSTPTQDSTSHTSIDHSPGYKLGTEFGDGTLTYTAADKAAGLSAGVAGLGGADHIALDASGTYIGGSGPDSFTLGSGLSGQYAVVGYDPAKVQPYQHVAPVNDFDSINLGSASVATIDLTLGRISGTSAVSGTVTQTPYTVNFAGVERINGASSPAGHVVTGRAPVSGFQYFPSGSDQISTSLGLDQPWNFGLLVSYGRGSFWNAGISVSYNQQGVGKVTSTAFSDATGDTLERVAALLGTGAADVFDMTNFGTNAAGTNTNIVGVSAGDTVIGNGETRLLLPGYALSASAPGEGAFVTLPDFTRRLVVDLAEGSFEAYTSNVTNNNFNAWAGAVKFSGVQGLYGSSQDETMLGNNQDNFFRTEDGDDYVDGRGGLDELNYWRQAEPVTIDMAAGIAIGGPSNGTDTFRRIEMVTGSVHADRYDASEFGSAQAVNVGDNGAYNAYRPIGGDDVIIGNGQTHVLYDLTMLPVEVNLVEGYARARVEADRLIMDDRSVGAQKLSGVTQLTGSVHADLLIGDAGNNVFAGGAGNDTIAGGLGQDVAVFSGARSFYTIQATAADQYTVTDMRAAQIQDPVKKSWSLNDGADQLTGIELLRFSDGEFSVKSLALTPSKLSGVAYHWKSHQLLDQVRVGAVHASDVGATLASWFDLRGSSFDHTSNTLRAEVWINPSSLVESFGFMATGPQGSSISFTSHLTSDWTVLGNTAQADRLSFGALIADANTAGLSSSTLIGTIVVQAAPGTENLSIAFSNILNGERPVSDDALAVSDSASDTSGRYVFEALPDGQYQLTAGRTTADGQLGVTAADAVAAMRLALGINPNADPDGSGPLSPPAVSPYQVIAADVDASGKVTAADVLSILKMSVGLSSAPASEWLFVEETRDFWDESESRYSIDRDNASWNRAISVQQPGETSLVGILKGDVTGSWRSSTAASDSNVVPASHFEALSALIGSPLDQWHA